MKIFLIIHFIVFIVLIVRDSKLGIIKNAALSENIEDVTPFSIIISDFFWEPMAILCSLIIIAFACSVPINMINKYFKRKYSK